MRTQPDVAEQILQKNGAPMHYKSIVDEAVKLGLIERNARNSGTLYANVRRAVASDTRFVKLERGVFDLAARQTQSGSPQQTTSQKDVPPITGPRLTDDVASNLKAMLSALDQASGVMETSMEKVRDVFCQRRNGPLVAQQIEATLRHHGLGHFPVSLNVKQHVPVILYRLDSVAGRLVEAAGHKTRSESSRLQAMDKICEIVLTLEQSSE